MAETEDVVTLLKNQHTRIRSLMDEVSSTKGEDRKRAFQDLVRLLVVHETAEEEVVHPYARKNIEGGERIVGERVEEEEQAKRALAALEDMDPDSHEFEEKFTALRTDVLAHADAEEKQEFTKLHQHAERGRLENLARAVKAAESVAPTRPHPGTDTAAKNLAVMPIASIIDRARDAIRAATGGARES